MYVYLPVRSEKYVTTTLLTVQVPMNIHIFTDTAICNPVILVVITMPV